MPRSMVLLTSGYSNPRNAKTATGLLRFCPDECVAVLDADHAGRTAGEILNSGGDTPFVASLSDVPFADTLVLGIAPPGGKIPPEWKLVIHEAIGRGMNILSGLHEFLCDDPDIVDAAAKHNVSITDVRKNEFKEIATKPGFRPGCLRLHTVGHDCSVGKMLVSLTIARGLANRGHKAHFIATGQTGIMVSGEGLPIDCVVADFVSGAAEKLVLDNEHNDILVVEGQGSLVHPAYSQVTLGLLQGCQPHGLIMVFEAGREKVGGMEHVPLMPLAAQRQLFETMGSIYQPCKTIAVAMNPGRCDPAEAKDIATQTSEELELPVVDVVGEGPDRMLDVIEQYYRSESW